MGSPLGINWLAHPNPVGHGLGVGKRGRTLAQPSKHSTRCSTIALRSLSALCSAALEIRKSSGSIPVDQVASNVASTPSVQLPPTTEIRRADGRFAPGNIQPKGGRKPGVPNKATTRMREFWEAFVESKRERLDELWEAVAKEDPKAAINIVLEAQEFFLAKLQRVEVIERSATAHADELSDEELEAIAARPPAPPPPEDPTKAN